MAKLRKIIVWAECPSDNVDDKDIAEFVEDALSSMGGCKHPQDPLFSSLSVKTIQLGETKYNFPGKKRD